MVEKIRYMTPIAAKSSVSSGKCSPAGWTSTASRLRASGHKPRQGHPRDAAFEQIEVIER